MGTLFQRDYDLLLYDLTSSYFEGLAEGNTLAKQRNPLAKRGYSRDHRSDCKQIILTLVVTREGFPLAHFTLAGNTQDVQIVEQVGRSEDLLDRLGANAFPGDRTRRDEHGD